MSAERPEAGPAGAGQPEAGPAGAGAGGHGPRPGDASPFEGPRAGRLVLTGLAVASGLLAAIDLLDVLGLGYDKHAKLALERLPAFYAVYGFLGCVVLIEGAKLLRRVILRPPGYWLAGQVEPPLLERDPNADGHHGHGHGGGHA